MSRRLAALLCTAALTALPATATADAAPAAGDSPVVCEDANNQIEVDFTENTAQAVPSIYHNCVSLTIPAIVYARVQPASGTATGSQSNALITIPDWTIRYYDASDNWVATSRVDITATYIGPLANLMAGAILSIDPVGQINTATASRACSTPDHCSYFNSGSFILLGEYTFATPPPS